MAHSQGMGGISWGGMSVGSWLRDEVMTLNMPSTTTMAMSPGMGINSSSYLPNLEAQYCKDYSCCGQTLPTLHDLLRHYEESHIAPSPPVEQPHMARNTNNVMEVVSTNDVFMSMGGPGGPPGQQGAQGMQHHPMAQGHHPTHFQQHPLPPQGHAPQGTQMPHGQHNPQMMQMGQPPQPTGTFDEDDEMCIDDPARHLYVMERGEHKPFKCPVIGCDKTYKNQNGLKYHRMHGHQNQMLHLNDDGTYSIIDPLSNAPYPNGVDMEKDKPYRCEICGKRYKNLNGLKYHRGHSTH